MATENDENDDCQIEIGKSYMVFFNKKHFLGKVTQLGSKADCKRILDSFEHELRPKDNIHEVNFLHLFELNY